MPPKIRAKIKPKPKPRADAATQTKNRAAEIANCRELLRKQDRIADKIEDQLRQLRSMNM